MKEDSKFMDILIVVVFPLIVVIATVLVVMSKETNHSVGKYNYDAQEQYDSHQRDESYTR